MNIQRRRQIRSGPMVGKHCSNWTFWTWNVKNNGSSIEWMIFHFIGELVNDQWLGNPALNELLCVGRWQDTRIRASIIDVTPGSERFCDDINEIGYVKNYRNMCDVIYGGVFNKSSRTYDSLSVSPCDVEKISSFLASSSEASSWNANQSIVKKLDRLNKKILWCVINVLPYYCKIAEKNMHVLKSWFFFNLDGWHSGSGWYFAVPGRNRCPDGWRWRGRRLFGRFLSRLEPMQLPRHDVMDSWKSLFIVNCNHIL